MRTHSQVWGLCLPGIVGLEGLWDQHSDGQPALREHLPPAQGPSRLRPCEEGRRLGLHGLGLNPVTFWCVALGQSLTLSVPQFLIGKVGRSHQKLIVALL